MAVSPIAAPLWAQRRPSRCHHPRRHRPPQAVGTAPALPPVAAVPTRHHPGAIQRCRRARRSRCGAAICPGRWLPPWPCPVRWCCPVWRCRPGDAGRAGTPLGLRGRLGLQLRLLHGRTVRHRALEEAQLGGDEGGSGGGLWPHIPYATPTRPPAALGDPTSPPPPHIPCDPPETPHPPRVSIRPEVFLPLRPPRPLGTPRPPHATHTPRALPCPCVPHVPPRPPTSPVPPTPCALPRLRVPHVPPVPRASWRPRNPNATHVSCCPIPSTLSHIPPPNPQTHLVEAIAEQGEQQQPQQHRQHHHPHRDPRAALGARPLQPRHHLQPGETPVGSPHSITPQHPPVSPRGSPTVSSMGSPPGVAPQHPPPNVI